MLTVEKNVIAPKCAGCANRMKLTHFGEPETFSYVCGIMPLTPQYAIEGQNLIPNVKDCSHFHQEDAEFELTELEKEEIATKSFIALYFKASNLKDITREDAAHILSTIYGSSISVI